jgi:hypothetical protein
MSSFEQGRNGSYQILFVKLTPSPSETMIEQPPIAVGRRLRAMALK